MAHLLRCLMVLMVLGLCSPPSARGDDRPAPLSLWKDVVAPVASEQLPEPPRPWVLQIKEIVLDPQAYRILKDAGARPHPPISIELFNGVRHELDITSTVSRINDTSIIRGSFKAPSKGDFSFVASGNLLIGTIQVGDRLYKTEHIVNGRLRLLEFDPDKMPPD